jgi:sec-independent protein translocase protein TatB
MEFLGVGASELIFIVIIALIVLGPKDMQKAGKTIGKWLRTIVTSDGWKAFQQTSREIRTLPNRLMREANEEVNKIGKDINAGINVSGAAPARPGPANIPPLSKPVPPTAPGTTPPSPETGASAPGETAKDEPGSNG